VRWLSQKADRASDIDARWLNGFGFPRDRGGLMYWADTIGIAEGYRQIQAWHQQYGERWAPSPLLRRLAETGPAARSQTWRGNNCKLRGLLPVSCYYRGLTGGLRV
jgi:3-hydroxyacyl-CoA dehydrogenase